MTSSVLIVLAVLWAVVLLPPLLQHHTRGRSADSISAFRNELTVLERRSGTATASRYAAVSATVYQRGADRARLARIKAKRRRRNLLVGLLAAAAMTLIGGIVVPTLLVVHLLTDLLLAGYVAILVRLRKLAEERSMKVRYLSDGQARRAATVRVPQASSQHALRRTAAN